MKFQGATKMHHLEEAVSALNIQLTSEDIIYLEELYKPHPYILTFGKIEKK